MDTILDGGCQQDLGTPERCPRAMVAQVTYRPWSGLELTVELCAEHLVKLAREIEAAQ